MDVNQNPLDLIMSDDVDDVNYFSSLRKDLFSSLPAEGNPEKGTPPKMPETKVPQHIKLLSTAKNIPRSAFDLPNISTSSDRIVTCSKLPPFLDSLPPDAAMPQVSFLTLQDDDLTDSQYGVWLERQLVNSDQVEVLHTRPKHLKSIAPVGRKPSDDESKFCQLKNLANESIYLVSKFPADYNSILTCFLDTISMGASAFGDSFMTFVAKTIYETCLREISFCHIASKLVAEISKTTKTKDTEIGFRSILLSLLQKEYSEKDDLAKSVELNDRTRLQTLTMFIGELLVNFRIANEDGEYRRIRIFSKLLPPLLNTLTSVPSQSNIRTASQVLRMGVGPIIELENSDTSSLQKIWHLLSTQARNGNEQAKKVLIHRATGWKSYFPQKEDSLKTHPQRSEPDSYEFGRGEPVFFTSVGIPYYVSSLADPRVMKELFY